MSDHTIPAGPGMVVFVVNVVFQGLSVIAVALRIWATFVSRRKFEIHDYCIFVALIFSLGWLIAYIVPGIYVYGRHIWEIDESNYIPLGKGYWADIWLWVGAITFVKLSVLHFQYTVFVVSWFRKTIYVIALAACLFWLGTILLAFLMCDPIDKFWDSSIPGHCGSVIDMEIADPCINMFLDLCVVLIPWPIIWKLNMTQRKKILLTCLLSLGLCVCAMNAGRLAVVVETRYNTDYTYCEVWVTLFTGLEIYVAIISACSPLLGPLFHQDRKPSETFSGIYPYHNRRHVAEVAYTGEK